MKPGEVTVVGRAEIDSRQPFRSVKEAVMLFGEKVLVAEIYGSKLKEMRVGVGERGKGKSKIAVLTSELQETRQSLQRTKEEGNIKALKQEVEKTKKDVQQLSPRNKLANKEEKAVKKVRRKPTISMIGWLFANKITK